MSKVNRGRGVLIVLFLAPSLVVFTIYRIIPIAWNLILSFQRWKLIGVPRFIGFSNYLSLWQDPVFWESFKNTLYYFFGGTPIAIGAALALSLLVNKPLKGRNLYRALIFLPYPITPVAIAIIWKWLYDEKVGLINFVLRSLGIIRESIGFLSSFTWALPSVIFTTIWQSLGYYVILLLAGLQTIPDELYEAAEIDGATSLRKLQWITLPLLKPSLFLCFIVGIINSFTTFDVIYVMTNGGPGNATEILVTYIYKKGFTFNEIGPAAAMTVILFIFLLLITMVSNKVSGGEAGGVHYYE